MQIRLRQAREEKNISAVDMAEMLGVHPSTVVNWESGRRQITPNKLFQMADILGFTVDYLLGRDCVSVSQTEPVDRAVLQTLHGQPVWSEAHGWMLVNILKASFILHDLSLVAFDEVKTKLYLIPPALSISLRGAGKPLRLDDLLKQDRVWLEPISSDTDLASELRGWYVRHDNKYMQNEFGSRFYFNTYGVKWLAFGDCFGGSV